MKIKLQKKLIFRVEEEGNANAAKIIRMRISSEYKNLPKVGLDDV